MGLFQHKQKSPKKSATDDVSDTIEQIFDEEFREELRTRGRVYFERVINESATLFKQDLDATIAHINTELRQHVARQLDEQFIEITKVNDELKTHIATQIDEQFVEYNQTIKNAQDLVLQSLTRSAQALQEQHQQLSATLQKNVTAQEAMMNTSFEENKARIDAIKNAQDLVLQSLTRSAQALQEQHQQLSATLQKNVATQEAILVNVFEENMGKIIEHYLLGALGDQYDLKAQLPSIIKQMEINKQAIVDDMKL